MKRKIALLLTMALGVSCLAGCGSHTAEKSTDQTSSAAGTAAASSKNKNVTLSFGTHQSGIPSCGVLQDLAGQFEEETGIKIDFQVSPDAQWRDLLKVKLDSGEAPDIFCVDADPLSLYSRVRPDETCVDLSGEEWVDRMADYAKECVSYDDKIYAIRFAEPKLNFYNYNKKIFADLGLEIPATYEAFKTVCQKIQDSGTIPIYEATQSAWHQCVPLYGSGPYFEKLEPGLYDALNNNEKDIKDVAMMKTILDQMKEFADLGYYGEDYLSNTVDAAKDEIGTGKAAMYLAAPGFALQVEEAYPEMKDQIGIFLMPFGDNDVLANNASSAAYFINKKSENVEYALEFFRFLARPENLQYRQDNNPEEMGLCWPEITPSYPDEFNKYIDSLERGTIMQVGVKYIDPQFMDTGKDIEAMYTGAMTSDQVMESISRRRAEQAELQKDPAWE